jgi:hypothetical protein
MFGKPFGVNLSHVGKNTSARCAFFQMSLQHLPVVMTDFAGGSQSC